LLGPFIDAQLKLRPNDYASARRCLSGFVEHGSEACVGTISEIFDATAPFTPRGCIAQAWSVAEVLRCWVLTAPPDAAEENSEATQEPKQQLADLGSRR
jgi:glycogen debranching enzyme